MPIRAQCSAGHVMMVPDHRAGTTLRCPRCGIDVAVPGTAKTPALTTKLAIAPPLVEAKLPLAEPQSASREARFAETSTPTTKSPATRLKTNVVAAPPEQALAPEQLEAPTAAVLPPPAPSPLVSSPPVMVIEPPLQRQSVAAGSTLAVAGTLPQSLPSSRQTRRPANPPVSEVPPPDLRDGDAPSSTLAEKLEPRAARGQALPLDWHQQSTALFLAALVCGLAIFSLVPAVWEAIAVWQSAERVTTPPWVYALAVMGTVQFAFGIYLLQLPDWSVLWTTTIAQLASAAMYALLLGVTLFARGENAVVLLFRYSDKVPGNRAAMWCFIMLCFTSVAVYALGFTASRWYRAYRVRRELA